MNLKRTVYSKGPCELCRKKRDCYRGRCWVCRRPIEIRALIEAGVPYMSAYGLLGLLRKCLRLKKTAGQAHRMIEFVHPDLMENVWIDTKGRFRLQDPDAGWVRNNGWMRNEQP